MCIEIFPRSDKHDHFLRYLSLTYSGDKKVFLVSRNIHNNKRNSLFALRCYDNRDYQRRVFDCSYFNLNYQICDIVLVCSVPTQLTWIGWHPIDPTVTKELIGFLRIKLKSV